MAYHWWSNMIFLVFPRSPRTAIFKMAYFPASKRTRTSLVFKKDRKGNRLNQHWSICEASQQGKICIFTCGSSKILPAHHSYLRCTVLWILTVINTLQSTITKTTFESLPLFHFIFSTHSGNEQIINFEGCSPFFYVLVFIVPAPFSAPDGRSSYQTILGDCLERDVFECLHVCSVQYVF